MGLLNRLFGRKNKLPYPPALASQVAGGMESLKVLMSIHDRLFQISKAGWSVNQDAGTIIFTSPAGVRAIAPVQIIGTYNTQDGTWLWGWDHPSVEGPLAKHAKDLFAYGQENNFELLTNRKLTCPEEQCLELAALACMVCNAQGVYCGEAGTAKIFFAFGKVSLNKPDFSTIDSKEKAEELFKQGVLEKCFLIPLNFGGTETPKNTVYVPVGIANVKQGVDDNEIRPLIAAGKAKRYTTKFTYHNDRTVIPTTITIAVSDPSEEISKTIHVWGDTPK